MEPEKKIDLTRHPAGELLSPEVIAEIRNVFEYHPWDDSQQRAGMLVRNTLAQAYQMLIQEVPACPTRTRALNLLTDARMLANAAITHKGRY